MPYHIIKVPGGYKVENMENKRRYSDYPLSLKIAKRQLAAMYIHTKEK